LVVDRVPEIVESSPREQELRNAIVHLDAQIKIKAKALENFDKSDSSKRRKKLLTRHNKTKRGVNVL
jgi:hypothetical protein